MCRLRAPDNRSGREKRSTDDQAEQNSAQHSRLEIITRARHCHCAFTRRLAGMHIRPEAVEACAAKTLRFSISGFGSAQRKMCCVMPLAWLRKKA